MTQKRNAEWHNDPYHFLKCFKVHTKIGKFVVTHPNMLVHSIYQNVVCFTDLSMCKVSIFPTGRDFKLSRAIAKANRPGKAVPISKLDELRRPQGNNNHLVFYSKPPWWIGAKKTRLALLSWTHKPLFHTWPSLLRPSDLSQNSKGQELPNLIGLNFIFFHAVQGFSIRRVDMKEDNSVYMTLAFAGLALMAAMVAGMVVMKKRNAKHPHHQVRYSAHF